MTPRSIRRAAERLARKQELKASRAQLAANQANAQLSTGPQTEAGKAASSQNRRTYGLTGAFVLLPHEDANEYHALYESLLREHQPATATETLLVKKMAQHQWLSDRALYQQSLCFEKEDFFAFEKQVSLFMRYHTTHHRAFHQALTELQKAQQERRQQELALPQLRAQHLQVDLRLKQARATRLQANGFESQNVGAAPSVTSTTTPTAPSDTFTGHHATASRSC